MKYIQWLSSIGLSLAIVPAAVGLGNQATAQTAPIHLSLRQTMIDFFSRDDAEDRSRGQAGTSRGEEESLCILTPGRNEIIWHQQPFFAVQGAINRIEVREPWKDLTQPAPPILGVDRTMPNADGFVLTHFGDMALQPGTDYEWLFYDTLDDDILYLLPFSVMEAGEERDKIATDLAQLEAELTQEGATTEAIAQAQADYFLARDMPADALQSLFAIEEPSADLVALRTETIETICSFRLGHRDTISE
ncbi:MAG: hypothetical protein ACTS2F_08055 [Thainema sp.]